MKLLKLLFLFFALTSFAQEVIQTKFVKKIELKADSLIGIDNFKTIYYTKNYSLIKKENKSEVSYSNIQLGKITTANSFNPLKINLFYKDFNTAIILDNRLAEIFKIDFNAIKNYKNVTHISTGYDNTLWVFNQDTQQLELYDYKNDSTRATTFPIAGEVLDLKSNYNSCWLLTKDYLYLYNYFGSLILKVKNNNYTKVQESNENSILQNKNKLYYLKESSLKTVPIKISNLLINQFFVVGETLYIYNDETLHQYQLKLK